MILKINLLKYQEPYGWTSWLWGAKPSLRATTASPVFLAKAAWFVLCHHISEPCVLWKHFDSFGYFVCIGWTPFTASYYLGFSSAFRLVFVGEPGGQQCSERCCLWETQPFLHRAVKDQAPFRPLKRVKGDIKWMENTRMNHHSSLQLLYLGEHITL